jgi:hypothetical protein
MGATCSGGRTGPVTELCPNPHALPVCDMPKTHRRRNLIRLMWSDGCHPSSPPTWLLCSPDPDGQPFSFCAGGVFPFTTFRRHARAARAPQQARCTRAPRHSHDSPPHPPRQGCRGMKYFFDFAKTSLPRGSGAGLLWVQNILVHSTLGGSIFELAVPLHYFRGTRFSLRRPARTFCETPLVSGFSRCREQKYASNTEGNKSEASVQGVSWGVTRDA